MTMAARVEVEGRCDWCDEPIETQDPIVCAACAKRDCGECGANMLKGEAVCGACVDTSNAAAIVEHENEVGSIDERVAEAIRAHIQRARLLGRISPELAREMEELARGLGVES